MNPSKLNIFILCLLSIVLCLTGCRPKGILHSWEMKNVLVDLHKTDAMLQVAGLSVGNEEARRIYYAQVLEKHEVTQAEFDSSLVWYTAHPQLFDKIYPKVMAELKAQEDAFLALHADELCLAPENPETAEVSTQKAEFTTEQLDSILWVTQHGYPSSWQIRPAKITIPLSPNP